MGSRRGGIDTGAGGVAREAIYRWHRDRRAYCAAAVGMVDGVGRLIFAILIVEQAEDSLRELEERNVMALERCWVGGQAVT